MKEHVPAEIMLVLRKIGMPERVSTVTAIADWLWTMYETESADAQFQLHQRRRAERENARLHEAITGLRAAHHSGDREEWEVAVREALDAHYQRPKCPRCEHPGGYEDDGRCKRCADIDRFHDTEGVL